MVASRDNAASVFYVIDNRLVSAHNGDATLRRFFLTSLCHMKMNGLSPIRNTEGLQRGLYSGHHRIMMAINYLRRSGSYHQNRLEINHQLLSHFSVNLTLAKFVSPESISSSTNSSVILNLLTVLRAYTPSTRR